MHSYRLAEQDANRYVVGRVKPYDQKNEMFKRPFWDPPMMDLAERFYRKPTIPGFSRYRYGIFPHGAYGRLAGPILDAGRLDGRRGKAEDRGYRAQEK
jgi:hypothetical protein